MLKLILSLLLLHTQITNILHTPSFQKQADPLTLCQEGVAVHAFQLPYDPLPKLQDGFSRRKDVDRSHHDFMALCGLTIGAIHYKAGRWSEADRAYNDAFEFVADDSDPFLQAVVLNNLGILSADRGRFGEAIERYQRA